MAILGKMTEICSTIKVHASANGGEKAADKAIGRTRGGLNTKLHAIVDGLGTQLNSCCLRGMATIPSMLLNFWKWEYDTEK